MRRWQRVGDRALAIDAANDKSFLNFLKTTKHLSSGQSFAIKINPNGIAIGVGYRF